MNKANRVVWLLKGKHAGDNAQIAYVAEMLGWSVVDKQLRFNPLHHLPNLVIGARTLALTGQAAATLASPWPDLVISAGKRSAPIALFIRRQSGGATRLVHIGRPRARLDQFDLIITTPQYGLPHAPNVLELPLSLAIPRAISESERKHWAAEWAHLPRPRIVLSIGAGKFPQRLGETELQKIGRESSSLARRLGGSLIVMASPRTPDKAIGTLGGIIDVPAKFYEFDRAANPYQAALALADRLVVTSDSMSMMSEAINSGKPISIFRLPVVPFAPAWGGRSGIAAWLTRNGLLSPPRDMAAVACHLIKEKYASELGKEGEAQPAPPPPPYQDLVIERIKRLFE